MYKTLCGIVALSSANAAFAQVIPFETNAIYLGTIHLEGGEFDNKDVDSEELSRRSPADLADVFRSEPTVTVGGSQAVSQKLYVNGIEEPSLNVTMDGARQNNKIFHHNATNYIDPGLLKAVRVDPGVAPADVGANALAGSVAYETLDARDLLTEGDNFGGRVRLEYTSNGASFGTSLTLFGRSGGFEALGYLKYADGDDQINGAGDDILGSSTMLQSGLLKFGYTTQSGYRFEVSHEKVQDAAVRPFRANMQDDGGGRFPATRTYDLTRQNTVVSISHDTPTDMWDPELMLGYSVTDLDTSYDESKQFGRADSFSAVFKNTFSLSSGTVTAGIDFYNDVSEFDDRAGFATDEKARNTGIFAQARLTPTDRTRLSFGARYDFQQFEGVGGHTSDNSGLSWNVSGEYALSDDVTVSAGYSHVWGGIVLAEPYIQNPGWDYDGEEIDPATAQNVFLGVNGTIGAWTYGAKVFKTELENARAASWRGGHAITTNVTSQGYELSLGYNWGDGFANLAYADIRGESEGDAVSSYPGNYLIIPVGRTLTLQAAHTFGDIGVTIGGDVEHAFELSDTFDPWAADGDAATIDAYTVANVYADWTPRQANGLVIRAEVNNLFDADYSARGTYGLDYTHYEDFEPLTEPGRSLRVSATYNF